MPPGRIRTHNLSRRAAEDLRLRPRRHWDRLSFEWFVVFFNYISLSVTVTFHGVALYSVYRLAIFRMILQNQFREKGRNIRVPNTGYRMWLSGMKYLLAEDHVQWRWTCGLCYQTVIVISLAHHHLQANETALFDRDRTYICHDTPFLPSSEPDTEFVGGGGVK